MKIMLDVVTIEGHDVDAVLNEKRVSGDDMRICIARYAAEHVRGFDHLYPQAKSKIGKALSERARMKRLSKLPRYTPIQLELNFRRR